MPKFRVYLAASVDGYIAEADGSVAAWLDAFGAEGSENAKVAGDPKETESFGYEAFIATIDTLVMGRTTFDQVLSFDVRWAYAGKHCVVMTHRDTPDYFGRRRFVHRGRGRGYRGEFGWIGWRCLVGGWRRRDWTVPGRGPRRFLEIFVMPVLLGRGIPTFPRDRVGPGPDLHLTESEAFDSDVVRLLYAAH